MNEFHSSITVDDGINRCGCKKKQSPLMTNQKKEAQSDVLSVYFGLEDYEDE